jgi:hypothetical protein
MLALLLADTSTRDDRAYGRSGGGGGGGGEGCSRRGLMSDEEAPLNSSFQQRVQKISEGLDSNRCVCAGALGGAAVQRCGCMRAQQGV